MFLYWGQQGIEYIMYTFGRGVKRDLSNKTLIKVDLFTYSGVGINFVNGNVSPRLFETTIY